MNIKSLTAIITSACLIGGIAALGTTTETNEQTEKVLSSSIKSIVTAGSILGKESAKKLADTAETIKTEKIEEEKELKEVQKHLSAPVKEKEVTKTSKPTQAQVPEINNEPSAIEKAEAAVNGTSGVTRVIALANLERAKAGIGMLSYDATLAAIAEQRAREIAKNWSHTRENGTCVDALAKEYGLQFTVIGENLAKGQKDADSAINAWLSSAGHRRNLLKGNYTKTGVAVVTVGGRNYWVQLFSC